MREKELEQFGAISKEWMQREADYKAEIKRLELILARESREGIASVALARQDSLVDRSKRFTDRLKRLSNFDTTGVVFSSSPRPNCKLLLTMIPIGDKPDHNTRIESSKSAELAEATSYYRTLGRMIAHVCILLSSIY